MQGIPAYQTIRQFTIEQTLAHSELEMKVLRTQQLTEH